MKRRDSVPKLPSSTGPIFLGAIDTGPVPATEHVGSISLMPEGVAEPQYLIRRNRVRCTWCGATRKTRAKYIAHFERRHNGTDDNGL